ncbi:A24 family peptidase [Bacillota bacterium]
MANYLSPLFVFLYGLAAGSFLNVCIYRIPLDKSVVRGRSYCPDCNSLIPWYGNIPLFSFIFLRGRCKDCGNPISPVYPLVELLNALLWLAVWFRFGLVVYSLLLMLLCSLLIIISFIDLKHKIIPDRLVLIILLLGLANALHQSLFLHIHWSLWVLGFFAASLPLYVLGLINPDGMGGGDIKLMAACGLFSGWKLILLSLFLGAVYALIYSAVLFALGRPLRKVQIPFAPFLSLGIATSLFAGESLISLYLQTFAGL